jgi:phosphate:Na+ symporter
METINWSVLIYSLLGGLGMFLYGMKMMSEGLQRSAGNSLRAILEKLTANRVVGTLVGLIVTMIIQSSSATTVMVVGFVNAGLMSLTQSLSIVLGANIGTTVTAQLIAFKITTLALPAIGVGAFLRLFSKNKKTQYVGEIIIGFGFLFMGLETMKHGFAPLKHSEAFTNAFVAFSHNPLLAAAAGALLTVIVQSSSATMGITIALATTGLIDYYTASAFVLGENIGTTVTANLAAIGATKAAKRAAFGHFMFNVIGVAYMLILLKYFTHFVDVITPGDPSLVLPDGTNPAIARHIANVHSLFNVINTIIFLPLIPMLAKICEKIIPGEDSGSYKLVHIDDRLLETPPLAIAQARKEVERMGDIAVEMLKMSKEAFIKRDLKMIEKIEEMEDIVDLLERDISDFVVKLYPKELSVTSSFMVNNIMHVIHDIEKIADYSENIARYTRRIVEQKINFSEEAMKEIEELFDIAIRFTENILKEFNEGNLPKHVNTRDEDLIDELRRNLKANHMTRLNKGQCDVKAGLIYVDLLNSLEKVGDHSFNIAQVIMGEGK